MNWTKKGLIYKPDGCFGWNNNYAQVPTGDKLDKKTLRIFFGTRDKYNKTSTSFIDVSLNDPKNILYIHNKPVLSPGSLGSFDDSGAMPSWIVNNNGKKYLYYTGWNVSSTVLYRNSIGLAVSEGNKKIFKKLYEGPILDRTYKEPYFCAQPCVIFENNLWRMWYLSCTKWLIYKNKPEPFYHIKYAESNDGINWLRKGIVCIDFKHKDEAGIVRSSVIKDNNSYKMWYSYRSYKDYRVNITNSYRIGFAESNDGISWKRNDKNVGIGISKSGWDSKMIAYPYVVTNKNKLIMLYNGNTFGKSGFGYAEFDNK